MLEHFLNIFQWKRETRLEFQPDFFFFFKSRLWPSFNFPILFLVLKDLLLSLILKVMYNLSDGLEFDAYCSF